MTQDEFEACVQRVWDTLPEDALGALAVLGAACSAFIVEVEKRSPGVAMSWMSNLQGFFDEAGVKT